MRSPSGFVTLSTIEYGDILRLQKSRTDAGRAGTDGRAALGRSPDRPAWSRFIRLENLAIRKRLKFCETLELTRLSAL